MDRFRKTIDIESDVATLRVRLTDVTSRPMYDIDLTRFVGPATIHSPDAADSQFAIQVTRVATYRGVEVPAGTLSSLERTAFEMGVDRTLASLDGYIDADAIR